MKIMQLVHIGNDKLHAARHIGMIICLILALISTMILSFYHATDVLFQFYLGYTLLRLSIFFFTSVIICASVFDKILGKNN